MAVSLPFGQERGGQRGQLQVVGGGRTPVIDTWWQTETGAHMIAPLPGATPLKPGSATLPFFGVEPAILDDKASTRSRSIHPWQGPIAREILHMYSTLSIVIKHCNFAESALGLLEGEEGRSAAKKAQQPKALKI